MNCNLAFALALSIAAVGNAFADDISVESKPFTSSLSIAQVRSDLPAFQAFRSNPWSQEFNPLATFVSSNSRAQSVAGYVSGRAEVAALAGEDSGSSYMTRTGRSRLETTRFAGQLQSAK